MENQNPTTTKSEKFKAALKAFGAGTWLFVRKNYLMFAYFAAALVIELTGTAVTSGRFYMTSPWIFLTFLAFAGLVSQYLPEHKSRYALFMTLLIINVILDFIFIVVFDSTGGTVFDFAMFNLRRDAMTIVEMIPLSFTFLFVSAVVLSLYGSVGFMLTRTMPKPDVTRSAVITTTALFTTAISLNVLVSYIGNARYDSNDLSYKLYQTETGTYSNKGIVGNFYNELVRGLWFSKIDIGSVEELHDFIYRYTTKPTDMHGKAAGYNVVTVLCESFEWFTFLFDPERYPNGFALDRSGAAPKPVGAEDADAVRAKLHELYPNMYRFYESQSTIVLNNSHSLEKTDISENKSIIGNYPMYEYINYAYPENTIPYSIPNILKTLYGVESNSFHNGYKEFYNRNVHHTSALGFNSYTASEDYIQPDDNDSGGVGERNLDSEMMETNKQKMFPTDRRFNTYITTITMHGQYAERENLKPYYDKLDELGILPYVEGDEDANALRYYCAAGMDTDKAFGIMLDYLEENGLADKTLITLFGDHNSYYQGISNYVKNIYSYSVPNYTELYRVPVMIKVGTQNLGNPFVNKFTCISDIYPTVLDLLGINMFSNLTYGVSAFADESSVLYSRAYDRFITDKIYFNSLDSITFRRADADDAYVAEVEKTASTLLNKISHVNRIFASDYFAGENRKEFDTLLHEINEPTL